MEVLGGESLSGDDSKPGDAKRVPRACKASVDISGCSAPPKSSM